MTVCLASYLEHSSDRVSGLFALQAKINVLSLSSEQALMGNTEREGVHVALMGNIWPLFSILYTRMPGLFWNVFLPITHLYQLSLTQCEGL